MEWEAGNVLVTNLRPVAFGEVLGLLKLCCDTATLLQSRPAASAQRQGSISYLMFLN